VTFGESWCLEPSPWPYCLDDVSPPFSPGEKVEGGMDAPAEFEPLGMYQAVECTTLSRDTAQENADETLQATGDWLLGRELQTGAVTGNPNLEGGTPLAAATTYAEALGALDQAIADQLSGRLGFIHVSPGDLAALLNAEVIWRDGRTWRSAAGNTIVSSPGYSFVGTLHATPEVFAATSPIETRVDIDRAINQVVAYAEQIGLAVFPPCFNVSVEVS
jgi:hypothetical protein